VLSDELDERTPLICSSYHGRRENLPVIMARRSAVRIEQMDQAEYHQGLVGYIDDGTLSENVKNWNGMLDGSEELKQHLIVR
jgi:hypothetical protein